MKPPLLAGLALLAATWLGPLPEAATLSFAAHMAMHVTVVGIAAPLLALGLAGSRLDPVARRPGLFPALPWSGVELVVVWAWHAPALHHLSRHHAGAMALEQASFLIAALAVWLAAFGGDRARQAGPGIAALLMTSTHMTLLGVLLSAAPRALFEHGAGGALADQQLGGVLMLAVAGGSYLAGGLWLLRGLLANPRGTRPAD